MSGEELGATRLQQPQKGPSNPSNVALIPDSQSKSQKEAIVAKPHDDGLRTLASARPRVDVATKV